MAEPQQPTAQAISEPQQPAAQAMESQVTSQTPAKRAAKNPKRVAAGKMVAERTRLVREEQKKAAAEAAIIIANNRQAKKATASPAPDPEPVAETEPKPAAADSNGLSTNQWISIIGIGATLATTYIKRDDIKAFFGKKKKQDTPPELAPVVKESPPPSRKTQPKKGIRSMD